MNRRLQTVLEIEHLSPAQFADALGIQRGGVSHLLSGRNKPSFDVLHKVLTRFPDISAEWLITGKGKPIQGNSGSVIGSDNLNNKIQDNNIQSVDEERNIFNQSSPYSSVTHAPSLSELDAADMKEVPDQKMAHNTPMWNHLSQVNMQRTVKRIIVYYSDGTFADYYPGTN